jgi:hypothetical protein
MKEEPGLVGVTAIFYQIFKADVPQIMPENRKGRNSPNSFYGASISLIAKLEKDTQKEKCRQFH